MLDLSRALEPLLISPRTDRTSQPPYAEVDGTYPPPPLDVATLNIICFVEVTQPTW